MTDDVLFSEFDRQFDFDNIFRFLVKNLVQKN